MSISLFFFFSLDKLKILSLESNIRPMVCLIKINLQEVVSIYIMMHIGCMLLRVCMKVMHLYAYPENKLQPHENPHFDHLISGNK